MEQAKEKKPLPFSVALKRTRRGKRLVWSLPFPHYEDRKFQWRNATVTGSAWFERRNTGEHRTCMFMNVGEVRAITLVLPTELICYFIILLMIVKGIFGGGL